MIIDFHTHIFPEKIAGKTLDFLSGRCQTIPFTDGTAKGLLQSADSAKIDLSIALPVVTKPSQFESINRFASHICESKLLSFGGIHPDSTDYKTELRTIKESGLVGIKLHPAYQETDFCDIKYKRILSYAEELELITVVHAGFDPGYPDKIYCTPAMAKEVIEEVHPEKLVLAHMGGYRCWDEVEKHLAGTNVFFDTAVVLGEMEEEQFIRICRNHGIEKILFATDSPWAGQKESIDRLNAFQLTKEEKKKIFSENARNLLTSTGDCANL